MKRTYSSILSLLLLTAVAMPGCSGNSASATVDDANKVVAYVGNDRITMADLQEVAVGKLKRLEVQRYETLRDAIDKRAVELLLEQAARLRGLTPDELIQQEVIDRVQPPTEKNIADFFNESRDRMPADATLDKMRPRLAKYLQDQAVAVLRDAFIQELKRDLGLEIVLEPHRIEITLPPGTPIRGPETAPITVIEFADFQCPYCRSVHPTVERLLLEYRDQIKFAFVDFPLENHKRAVPSSMAARCADDQGQFWDYHQALMVVQGDLSDDDLEARAADVGLNMEQFQACYSSESYRQVVLDNYDAGTMVGVTSTPTFLVNGRMIIGAKSYDVLRAVIEEELAAAAARVGG